MKKSLLILMVLSCIIYGQANLPYVTVVDDTVEFGIIDLHRNCGALFEMGAQLDNNIFMITALDTGGMALCGECYFDVKIIVGGVVSGNYSAEFYSCDLFDIDSTGAYVRDTTYIGEIQFSVNTTNAFTYNVLLSNQSECSHTQGVIEESLPEQYILLNNYPNPFNNKTVIEFYLSNNDYVKLSVHDIGGREIASLVNEKYYSGYHSINWNPKQVSSGVYFLSISTPSQNKTKKVLLIK